MYFEIAGIYAIAFIVSFSIAYFTKHTLGFLFSAIILAIFGLTLRAEGILFNTGINPSTGAFTYTSLTIGNTPILNVVFLLTLPITLILIIFCFYTAFIIPSYQKNKSGYN